MDPTAFAAPLHDMSIYNLLQMREAAQRPIRFFHPRDRRFLIRRAFGDWGQFARLAGEILIPEPPPKLRIPRNSCIHMPRSQSKAAESVGIGAGLVHSHN